MTTVASSGGRFTSFAPYVPSINDAGVVAFQASLQDGHSGVFTSDGQSIADVAVSASAACPVAQFTSHPDINGAGMVTVYGRLRDGSEALVTATAGGLAVIGLQQGFTGIGPLGPTMTERGDVAFRGTLPSGHAGIHLLLRDDDGDTSRTGNVGECITAATAGPAFRGFEGLPVVNQHGRLVFRADLPDGRQGIFSHQGGQCEAVALTGDAFSELARFPALNDHGSVAFVAVHASGGPGIFTVPAGGVPARLDTGPGFESFRGVLINNTGPVVFYGTPQGGQLGIYAGPDAARHRVLGIGDPLFGDTVADFALNPVSINERGQLAIRVALVSGRELILRADPS